MTQDEINANLQRGMQLAEQVMRRESKLFPSFTLFSKEAPDLVLTAEWDGHDERRRAFNKIRLLGIALDAHAIMLVHEGWMLALPVPAGMDAKTFAQSVSNIRPSQQPDRKSAVLAALVYRTDDGDRGVVMDMAGVEYDDAGEVLGLMQSRSSQIMSGSRSDQLMAPREITELLLPHPPGPLERLSAKIAIQFALGAVADEPDDTPPAAA